MPSRMWGAILKAGGCAARIIIGDYSFHSEYIITFEPAFSACSGGFTKYVGQNMMDGGDFGEKFIVGKAVGFKLGLHVCCHLVVEVFGNVVGIEFFFVIDETGHTEFWIAHDGAHSL